MFQRQDKKNRHSSQYIGLHKTDCKELTEKKILKDFKRDKTEKPDRSHRKRDRGVD